MELEPGIVLTESELIECAIAGNRAAFGEIYMRYLDAIYRYVYYRVGDTQEAEDLTETVFLKAWQAIAEYNDIGLKFSCWLYRIAHNVVVDFHRARSVRSDIEQKCDGDDETLPDLFIKQTRDIEDERDLAQAISKLTGEQQQIILLRFIEGLSHAEIAQIIHKTEGACRMLQNRALIALHQQLSGT